MNRRRLSYIDLIWINLLIGFTISLDYGIVVTFFVTLGIGFILALVFGVLENIIDSYTK
jgi:ABC-type dipeptide/oligopeptide/nickel transport system permease subunit